jgi:hypothetical protein
MSKNKNKIPITRLNKFFSGEDFNLELDMGREYLEGDLNMSVILYRVDRQATDVDSLYGEVNSSELRFLPPIELVGLIKLELPENKAYSKGSMRVLEHGKLTFSIYQEQLDELGVDVSYGDYIAYPENEFTIKYFTVVNDGKIFSDNSHTIFGYKGFYRTIICTPALSNEILP